jgi:hypothetical protein
MPLSVWQVETLPFEASSRVNVKNPFKKFFTFLVSFCAGILKQYIGTRNRLGIGCRTRTGPPGYIACGIESESIPVLLKSFKKPSLCLYMLGSKNPAKQSGKKIKPR